mgnify:CR=1 FL=1
MSYSKQSFQLGLHGSIMYTQFVETWSVDFCEDFAQEVKQKRISLHNYPYSWIALVDMSRWGIAPLKGIEKLSKIRNDSLGDDTCLGTIYYTGKDITTYNIYTVNMSIPNTGKEIVVCTSLEEVLDKLRKFQMQDNIIEFKEKNIKLFLLENKTLAELFGENVL